MQIITTDKIAKSNGPYSQGYTHNGFFFTAGQIGVEPSDGELHVHTNEEQTDRAYLCGRKNTAQTCPLRNRSHRRTGRLDFQKS